MKKLLLERMVVTTSATVFEALEVIERGGEAVAFVCDDSGRVVGVLTDGDVRRAILSGVSLEDRCLPRIMSRDFHRVDPGAGRAEVLDLMKALNIEHVPALDKMGKLQGVHLIREFIGRRERTNCAVIMAGGRGMRLRPLTEHIPKPMLPVAGRPILERLVLHLVGAGIKCIYLSINYLGHIVQDHFSDGSRFGCEIHYLHESAPLGTGGALTLLPEIPTEPILVMNGDLITQFDVDRIFDFHNDGDYALTIAAQNYIVQIPYGVVRVEDSVVTNLEEKPDHQVLVNSGIYVMDPTLLEYVPQDVEFPITDLVYVCERNGLRVGAHVIEEDWIDIGQPAELAQARGHARM